MKQALPTQRKSTEEEEKEPHMEMKKVFHIFHFVPDTLILILQRSIQPSFFRFNIHPRKNEKDIYFELRRSPKCWTDKGVTTSLPRQCLFHNQHILDFSIKVMLLWENLTMKYIQRLSSFKNLMIDLHGNMFLKIWREITFSK